MHEQESAMYDGFSTRSNNPAWIERMKGRADEAWEQSRQDLAESLRLDKINIEGLESQLGQQE
jgi:hypothetical protein